MSKTPTTIPTVQATPTSSNSNSNHSTSTAASTSTPSSTSTPTSSASKFAVGAIPAFKKGPINYAAAASKSKPSPPVVNGKDATAVIGGVSSASIPTSATASVAAIPARKQPAQPEVSVLRVNAVRGPADSASNVAFGNVNDKNATLSSSPAAPPSFNTNPKAFGTVPVASPAASATPSGTKPALDIHSFFTGGASPSQTSAALPSTPGGPERRSVATYDPSTNRSSPLPNPSNLSNSLSGNSQSFAPRQPLPFVPQQQHQLQQQQNFPSPGYGLGPPPPFHPQQHQQGGPAYPQQHGKSQAQNIPNGGGNYGQQQQGGPNGQRSGSFVGSPVMRGQPGTPTGRQQFPTSPRLGNAGLPQQQPGMMGYSPQGWNPQQQASFGGYNAYYPGMQQQQAYPGGPNPFVPQQQLNGPPSSIAPSGPSTPSAGIRTPLPSTSIPPSPSPVPSGAPSTPSSFNYSSPVPQSATLPHHAHAFHPMTPSGPPRTPSSPFSSLSGTAAFAAEFKPNVEAAPYSPSPRKSAAIRIVNPKKKLEADAAAAALAAANAPAVDEKKVAEDAEKAKKEAETAAAAKVAAEKKDEEDKAAIAKAENDAVVAAELAAAAKKEEEAVVKAAAAEAFKKEEVTLLAEEKVVAEVKEPAQALVEARQAIQASTSSPTALPAFLPAKPVNGATTPEVRSAPSAIDLAAANSPSVPAALPSALMSARKIDDLNSITYPESIKSPRPDLNADAEPGKYRYDRDFLIQFMLVCIEKPELLPNLEAIGMVDAGGDSGAGRGNFSGGSTSRRPSMGPPAVPNRGGGASSGFGGQGRSASTGGSFTMGSFQSPATTSEARFNASLTGTSRTASAGFPARPGGSMSRNPSQSGTQGNFGTPQGGRIRSTRGQPRDNKERGGGGGGGGGQGGQGKHTTGDGFEDAAPLEATEGRWTPSVIGGTAAAPSATDSPEFVQRKVKALLNKLTLEKFDSISDQILAWADKSVDEVDGRILRQVIALIFEKATDEANWSEMYARLCRKLMEQVSVNVKDETVKLSDGTAVAGGALFRKYLLNRCQEDYESGWKQKEVAAAAAAGKAADDNAKKEANDAAKKEEEEKAGEAGASASSSSAPKEAELLSDEYYAAQKAKRRGLGLVRFIGELYRLSMLTERIMHECIKKLLANTENPEEEDVESLCRLLTTVGKGLDNAKAKQHMDIYFSRMNQVATNMKISSRIRFMTQDVLELRKGHWQPRHDSAGPKLISEIHSDAQKASEEASRRVASSNGKGLPRLQDQMGSRPNSHRGNQRNQFGVAGPGADGWSAPAVGRPAKAGDLTSFGKIRDNSSAISMGPSGAFANKAALAARAKEAPRAPSNPFAALEGANDGAAPAPSSGRPRIILAKRTIKTEGDSEDQKPEETAEVVEEEDEDDGSIDPNAVSMSRAEGERRAGNSVKEFFSVKSIPEGVASVEALPAEYRGFLVTALADAAVQKKADDVNLTRSLFAEIGNRNVITHAVMLASLTSLVIQLVDLSIDVPSVYTFASQLLAGAGATTEEVEALALKMASEDEEEEDVARGRVSLLTAFGKLTSQ